MSARLHWLVSTVLLAAAAACSQPAERPPETGAATGSPRPAAPAAARQTPASASDQALARETQGFLESWLIKRDAQGAVRGRATASFPDERFVPVGWFDPDVYRTRFPTSRMNTAAPIQPQEFQDRLAQYVESLTDSSPPGPTAAARSGRLSDLLLPFSPATAREVEPQLYALLASQEPRELTVADVPVLAYRVDAWSDIAWTASGTIGYRAALGEQSRQKGIDVQAVVCRLRQDTADEPSPLLVTLWSDEGTNGTTWRLMGLELPPLR